MIVCINVVQLHLTLVHKSYNLFYYLPLMLSDESTIPVNFGTPPRKRQHYAMHQRPAPHQQRIEHSQRRLSLGKSTSQPSTVGSPFLRPSTK